MSDMDSLVNALKSQNPAENGKNLNFAKTSDDASNGADLDGLGLPSLKVASHDKKPSLPSFKMASSDKKLGLPSLKVASNGKKPNLPLPKITAPADDFPSLKMPEMGLPTPKTAPADDFPSLKMPEMGLPTPKTAPADDFPSFKMPEMGLPTPKTAPADDFPSLKMPDVGLPTPKTASTDDFPSLKMPEMGLQTPKAASTDDFPSFKMPEMGLPTPKSASTDDFPSLKMPDLMGESGLPSFKSSRVADSGLPLFEGHGDGDPLGLMTGSNMMSDSALDSGFPMGKMPPDVANHVSDDLGINFNMGAKSLLSSPRSGSQRGNSELSSSGRGSGGSQSLNSVKIAIGSSSETREPVRDAMKDSSAMSRNLERIPRKQTVAFSPFGFDDALGEEQEDAFVDDRLSSLEKPPSQERVAVPSVNGMTTAQYGEVQNPTLGAAITSERAPIPEAMSQGRITQERKPTPENLKDSAAQKIENQADPLGLMGGASASESSSSQFNPLKLDFPDFSTSTNVNDLSKTTIPAASVAEIGEIVNAYASGKRFEGKGEVTEAVDEEGDELVFDINSIKTGKTAASSATPKTSGRERKARRRKSAIIISCVAVFIALGCGALAMYNHIQNEKEEQLLNTPVVEQEKHIELNFEMVKHDRVGAYTGFYHTAREKLSQNSITHAEREEAQGQILVAVTLAMTRYPNAFKDDLEMLDASAAKISESCQGSWCALGLWSWGMLRNNEELANRYVGKISRNDAEIHNVVSVATKFAAWKYQDESYDEMMKSAQNILSMIHTEIKNWPLLAWIKTKTLSRMGKNDEALKVLEAVNAANASNPSASLLLLQAEILFALDKFEESSAIGAKIKEIPNADPQERKRVDQLALMIEATKTPWDAFENRVFETLKKGSNSVEDIDLAAEVCIRENRAAECKSLFWTQIESAPQNLDLRKAWIRVLIADQVFEHMMRPDFEIANSALIPLQNAVNDGIASHGEDVDLWRAKAILSFAQNDFDNAIKAIDEVERGQSLVWFGAFVRELIAYQTASDAKKESIKSNLRRYENRVNDLETTLALVYALEFVGDFETAQSLVQRASQQYPESTLVVNERFDLAVALKDRDLSQQLFYVLEKRNALTLHHEFSFARLLESLGDANAALERMLVLVARDSEHPNAQLLSYVGELFLKQDRCDSALPYFVQSLEVNANDDQTHFFKGLCLYKTGDFDDALLEFNEAATQNEGNRLYDLWIGMALAGLQHISEAQRAFTSVIDDYTGVSENPSPVDDKTAAEAYFFRAEIRKLQNYRSETRADYAEALAIAPNELRYLSGYAVFLYENGDLQESIEGVNRIESIEQEKIDSVLLFIRGLARLKLDQRDLALRDLETARDKGFAERENSGVIGVREPAEIYERLGFLYRDLGRKEEARSALRYYLDLSKTLSPNARKDLQSEIDKI